MRFVDAFRDEDKAHALAARIAALCEPGRQYKLMEVCGGHTHTIYKHGLEDYLPEPGEWVLIHVGFALSKIDEGEAAAALEFLESIGQAYADELAALAESRIE